MHTWCILWHTWCILVHTWCILDFFIRVFTRLGNVTWLGNCCRFGKYSVLIQSDSSILSGDENFPFLIFSIETNFVNKEKKFVIFIALGNSVEVIILAFLKKTFKLPWEYKKSSAKASLFLPSEIRFLNIH